MTIRAVIKNQALLLAEDLMVKDVRIGLGYTAVVLNDGRSGVAYTFHKDSSGGCTVFKGLRPLAGRRAKELLDLFDSNDKIESAVALATANALLNTTELNTMEGDVLEYLGIGPDDNVGMVGYFAPLISLIRKRAASLKVFEQIEEAKSDMLPEKKMYSELPHCQVVLLTSTSIINHTIDSILDVTGKCREVALLGASTPVAPEVFSGTPVTILSGVVVTEPEQILRIVSEGGGMRLFKNHIKKVNVRLK